MTQYGGTSNLICLSLGEAAFCDLKADSCNAVRHVQVVEGVSGFLHAVNVRIKM